MPTHPAPPETDSNVNLMYLLGGMNSKIDGIANEQTLARTEATEFRAEVRQDVSEMRGELSNVKSKVTVLESKQPVKLRWPTIVGGVAGLGAATTATILLIQWVANSTF